MFIHIILALAAGIALFYLYKICTTAPLLTAAQQANKLRGVDKKDIIILWDLHQVLFDRSLLRWAYLFITYDRKWQLIKQLNFDTFYLLLLYVLRKLRIISQEITSQEVINSALKINNKALIDLVMLISCEYTPSSAIPIAQELAKAGYQQHIGSNIGTTAFHAFSKQHISFFELFSYHHIIHVSDYFTRIKKPNKAFFTAYLQKTEAPAHHIVFIDDKKENIRSAQECGMIALLYKNPQQLIHDLKILHILQ